MVALTPAMIALADWPLFGAPMTPRRFIGVITAMLGCLLVVTRGDMNLLVHGAVGSGELLILGCVLLWSAYTFIGRRVNRTISPLAATFGACLTGWAMLTAAALADGSLFALQALQLNGALSIVFLGLLGTALSFTWYAEAVRDIGPTRAGMFINLVPVFGVLLGALMLQERLAAATYAGVDRLRPKAGIGKDRPGDQAIPTGRNRQPFGAGTAKRHSSDFTRRSRPN